MTASPTAAPLAFRPDLSESDFREFVEQVRGQISERLIGRCFTSSLPEVEFVLSRGLKNTYTSSFTGLWPVTKSDIADFICAQIDSMVGHAQIVSACLSKPFGTSQCESSRDGVCCLRGMSQYDIRDNRIYLRFDIFYATV